MYRFAWLFFMFSSVISFSYLNNNNATFKWIDIPTNSITQKNTNPYNGFGCTAYNKGELYLISSTNPGRYQYNNQQYCDKSKKYVEILKYNFNNKNFTDILLIGQSDSEYPTASGGPGSDNIVLCGINVNILYYIASNIHDCPSQNNYDSSIVRINLQTLQFMDRTIFKNIPNVPSFSQYQWSKYKYLNLPTTTQLINEILWIGFGGYYTGILKLNISSQSIELIESFQKKYKKINKEMTSMSGQDTSYDTTLREIKKSFINEKETLIYFLEDTGYSDSQLMIINYSIPITDNNSKLIALDGINYVSDIKFDKDIGKIYIITGSLSSEMYQYDLNFNKLQISEGCAVDFVKFPTEWGVITNIQIDKQTGFMYAPVSSRWGNNGIVSINQKDSSINLDSLLSLGENIEINNGYKYYQWYNNMNITNLLLDKGLLIVASNHYSYRTKLAFVDLNGCAFGRGKNALKCDKCIPGRFSNKIGGICESCQKGLYSNMDESTICNQCVPGKYTSDINSISCLDCPNGFYTTNIGSIECSACNKGRYSTMLGSYIKDECLECEPGKISGEGSNRCDFCQVGKWAKAGKICELCPKGRYSFSVGLKESSECTNCPIGKYNNEQGLILENKCKECQNGHIGVIEGAKTNTSCFPCEKGKYRSTLSECAGCDNGYISKHAQENCVKCAMGKVSDYNKITCLKCDKGKYGDSSVMHELTSCKLCVSGKFSNRTGIIDNNRCISCPMGRYNIHTGSTSTDNCKYCEAGKYRNDIIGIKCTLCQQGKYSKKGANECMLCDEGMYVHLISNMPTSCKFCPSGKFINKGGYLIESCKNCPAGKWSNEFGMTSVNKCINCPHGKYSDVFGANDLTTCLSCPAGKFNQNDGASSINFCEPCSTGSMSLTGAFQCIGCVKGRYTELISSSECKICKEGKFTPDKNSISCDICPDNSEENFGRTACFCVSGTYNNKINGIECIQCPDNFICEKGTNIENIVLKPHYWRETNITLNTYKCKNRFACKGGKFGNSTDDFCQPGHKGPICDVCEKGWSKDDGVCLKCPENIGRTISLTIAIPVICILIIIFLIKTANPANNKKEEVNGVVKIFMNYAQVFSLASSFQINWPTLVRYLFERAKEFSSPRVSFYSSDCAIGWGYYDKFIVYLTLPIVYIIMTTFVIFILSLCYCKKKRKKMKNMTNSQVNVFKTNSPTCLEFFTAWEKTAVVVGTFLSWPTIVEKTLEIMNCQKIGEKYYLVKDVSVVCYDSQHYIYLTIGYIGLIIYGIGIPLLGFRLLYGYRFRLFDMQNRYDGSTPLSFLFLGYREKRWYYEFIIMGKKAGLILLAVFLRNYPRYQVIGASLLIQISFFLHVFLRPYDTITSYGMICNRLESVSLLALVMTLSTGLFFGTIDSGYNLGFFENVLIALLLFSNGALCLYFFVYFVHLTFKTAKTHFREFINEKLTDESTPCMFKCLSDKKIVYLKDWADLEMVDDYGIHLKNQVEKEIFTNYFKEKQSKLGILNSKIDSIKKRRVSVKLDKLRSEIQVMEKQRCWQTIQNNRLYSELKKVTMLNKSSLNEDELAKLNDVFKLYVEHGIQYNQKINGLYMQELHGMLPETNSFSNENIVISQSHNIVIEVTEQITEQIVI